MEKTTGAFPWQCNYIATKTILSKQPAANQVIVDEGNCAEEIVNEKGEKVRLNS